MIPFCRRHLRELVILLVVAVVAVVAGLSIASLVSQQRDDEQRDRDLLKQNRELIEQLTRIEEADQNNLVDHRSANQSDHDEIIQRIRCIETLALLLSDPKRDRTMRVVPPPCPVADE